MMSFTERTNRGITGQKKDPGEFNLRQNVFKVPHRDVQVLDTQIWNGGKTSTVKI